MSDAEWDALRSTFQQKQGALPEIEKRAVRMRTAMKRSNLALAALTFAELGLGAYLLARGSPAGKLLGAGLMVYSAIRGALFFALQRRTWGALGQTPDAQLDDIARQLAAGRRLVHMLRWTGSIASLGSTALILWTNAQRPTPHPQEWLAVFITVQAAVVCFLLPNLTARRHARSVAELDAWRAEMDAAW